MTIRDEVALIIDPESIKGRESYAALPGFVSPEAAQKAADYQFGKAIKEAYAKADAILALSPPEPTEGQVERVARAIYHVSCAEADDGERPIPSFDQSHSRLVYLDMARAAIRAMPLQDHAKAVADEREACAAIAEDRQGFWRGETIAAEIRARAALSAADGAKP